MSSHREAPEISKDPVADSTDVYTFVSPDRPDTVTIIANYIPLEDPAGGPNFFEFGDDVLYRINIDNTGDGRADLYYDFRFTTEVSNPDTFLYNVGPIGTIDSPNWVRKQFYAVRETRRGQATRTLATGLASPPCNVGFRSIEHYEDLAFAGVHTLEGGMTVFAGQRVDPFYVDLGSIFDLGALRPFQNLHLIPSAAAPGVNALRAFNVHSIAIQIPIDRLTRRRNFPKNRMGPQSVIGVWTSAYRQKGHYRSEEGNWWSGPFTQVSRLGNPLFNEVIVPMARKDEWNRRPPPSDSDFAQYVARPHLAALLPILYPGVFPNLAALDADRADLLAILLTGLPPGIIPDFQNFMAPTQADMLRLNVAIPPTDPADAHPNGILGGDLAGFPNGRRVLDNVVTVELQAVAGATYPLVDPSYTPDGAASLINDGVATPDIYLDFFPYCGHPVSGYEVQPLSV